ncbi:MAG TPA: glycosylasparaginase, partial [Chitinophagaceae bacterium]|nr:glycosylasparaginase [Chitinophagaceae bacterium]
IELMRQGMSPEKACKKAIGRVVKIKKEKAKDIQVAFLALNKKGQAGAFAIHKGFTYAIKTSELEKLVKVGSWFA